MPVRYFALADATSKKDVGLYHSSYYDDEMRSEMQIGKVMVVRGVLSTTFDASVAFV